MGDRRHFSGFEIDIDNALLYGVRKCVLFFVKCDNTIWKERTIEGSKRGEKIMLQHVSAIGFLRRHDSPARIRV